MNKRKLKAIETKKKLYEAARRLAHEYGFENVSVDAIVEAAGVSKGAFYVHFESKDALAAELVNEYTKYADFNYKAFLSTVSEEASVLEVLALLARKISTFLSESIGYENMRVLYRAYLTKSAFNTMPAISYNRELYRLLSEVLEKGIRKDELREDIPVEDLAKHLIMAIRGIAFEWCIRYPDFDLERQISDHFKILLYGLRK
jgi:AcrR family transcriptional regulator